MLGYDEFKKDLEGTLNEGFKRHNAENYVCEIGVMDKVNSYGEECVVIRDTEKTADLAARVSLGDLYKAYKNGMSMEEIVLTLVERRIMSEKVVNVEDMTSKIYDRDFILKNVEVQVINKEVNAEILKTAPYREIEGFDDVVAVARCDASLFFDESLRESSSMTMLVNNNMLALSGISKEELIDTAISNSEERYPISIRNLLAVVRDLGADRGMDDIFGLPEESPLYVMMASPIGNNGARALAYSDFKEQLRNTFGGDCYVFPSSIHELIMMPASEAGDDEGYLLNMIRMINQDVLLPKDFLSDNMYKYDFASNSIKTISEAKENIISFDSDNDNEAAI